MAFWVRQGGRDRDTEELQGVSPDAGRLGEHRHAGRGSVTAAELVTPDGDLSAPTPALNRTCSGLSAGAAAWDRKGSFEPQIVRKGQGPGRTRQPPSHQPTRHRKPPALPPGRNGPCTGHRPARSTG